MVRAILEPKEDAEEVADTLVGTCLSLGQGLEMCGVDESAVDNEDFCSELDSRVFCCEGCGWWTPAEDLHDETGRMLCDECAPGEEDDE